MDGECAPSGGGACMESKKWLSGKIGEGRGRGAHSTPGRRWVTGRWNWREADIFNKLETFHQNLNCLSLTCNQSLKKKNIWKVNLILSSYVLNLEGKKLNYGHWGLRMNHGFCLGMCMFIQGWYFTYNRTDANGFCFVVSALPGASGQTFCQRNWNAGYSSE